MALGLVGLFLTSSLNEVCLHLSTSLLTVSSLTLLTTSGFTFLGLGPETPKKPRSQSYFPSSLSLVSWGSCLSLLNVNRQAKGHSYTIKSFEPLGGSDPLRTVLLLPPSPHN
jgi:hypothetical protein